MQNKKNNSKKIVVSPTIDNNGNRNFIKNINKNPLFINAYKKEFSGGRIMFNEKIKEMFLKDEELLEFAIIHFLFLTTTEEQEKPDTEHINGKYYTFFKDIYLKNPEVIADTQEQKKKQRQYVEEVKQHIAETIDYDLFLDMITTYNILKYTEIRDFLETFSKTLYLQHENKDNELGQKIDQKIKFIKQSIEQYVINNYEQPKHNVDLIESQEELIAENEKLGAITLFLVLSRSLYEIKKAYKTTTLTDEWQEKINAKGNITEEEFIEALKKELKTLTIDATSYYDLSSMLKRNIKEIEETPTTKKNTKTADILVDKVLEARNITLDTFNYNYVIELLAYDKEQKKNYKLSVNPKLFNTNDIVTEPLYLSTSKHLKFIDNARGGLITYTETETKSIKDEIKEKEQSLKNTDILEDKNQLRKEIKKLRRELKLAEEKEQQLNDEYNELTDYLGKIHSSMEKENKNTSYFKTLKKNKLATEKRIREIERIIHFNGWQLDIHGNGTYNLYLDKSHKKKLTLTIEDLSKQLAKYTKEEQDIFDFLVSKYLNNTNIKEIKFTLREYEKEKGRIRPDKQLIGDIQALRLLFRETWSYYTTNDNEYTFTEEHLFNKLSIKGKLEPNTNKLDNITLDTKVSLEPTETLQKLLKEYLKTPPQILKLNNDNEYLAKRLVKYLYYLARTRKTNLVEISLEYIIEELQHYGLKHYNSWGKNKSFKTEIVDTLEKAINIAEGENHLDFRFIELLTRTPFTRYDLDYKGKKQETTINEWGKQKVTFKIYAIDEEELKKIKQKRTKKKKTTKNN